MLTIAFAAALASPAVAQSQWREGPLPPDVQDIKAAGLMPYGKPILPGQLVHGRLSRLPPGRRIGYRNMARDGRGVATLVEDRMPAGTGRLAFGRSWRLLGCATLR